MTTITAERAEQAKGIILDTLDGHHQGRLPYRQVWTKATEDFDGVPLLDVWVIYDGKPDILDIGRLNSYGSYLYRVMLDAGIRAIPCISYIPESDVDQLGTPWSRLLASGPWLELIRASRLLASGPSEDRLVVWG